MVKTILHSCSVCSVLFHKRFTTVLLHLSITLLLAGCGSSSTTIDDQGINDSSFNWQVRSDLPLPIEPSNNPMTEPRFQLGRHLFYDIRLSGNGTQSCASCHQQDKAFTDELVLAIGSTGEPHPRNSQSLTNAAYNATQTWANPSLLTLEQQIRLPLFSEEPIEQGINDENRDQVLLRIQQDTTYQSLFAQAFPNEGIPIDYDHIVKSIASFVRGLTSFNSPFDAFEQGNPNALSASAHRGRALFFSEALECFHCHGGYNFSDSIVDRTLSFIERPFHNTGLYNLGGNGDFPADNQGVFSITGDPSDMGRFRAPTLRNVEVTAPYMHDGSIETLEQVLDFYAAGGRLIESGPYAGDGRSNPFKDGFINGFDMNEQDKADLVEFLHSLTDTEFLQSDRISNPWQ